MERVASPVHMREPRPPTAFSRPRTPASVHEDLIWLAVDDQAKLAELVDNDAVEWSQQMTATGYTKRFKQRKTGVEVHVNGERLALFLYRHELYAVQGDCPHAGGDLVLADIEDFDEHDPALICPFHNWRFSLRTGEGLAPRSNDQCLQRRPVRVTPDRRLEIGFPSLSPSFFTGDV